MKGLYGGSRLLFGLARSDFQGGYRQATAEYKAPEDG